MNEARFRGAEERLWSSLGLTPSERRLDLARTGVAVRVQEVGEGPPVLFVHGGTNGGTSWATLAARLSGFRCVMLDRPGCGLSEPLKGSFADVGRLGVFAEGLIVDVLDALDLESAPVVATSFGGYFAPRSAAAHPERIGRMVLMGWSLGAPLGPQPLAMRLASVPFVGRMMASIPPNERIVKAMLRNIGLRQAIDSGRFSQEAIDWYLALLRDTNTLRNELAGSPALMSPFRGMNRGILLPGDLLASIGIPVHFLWGEEDVFGGADVARAFVKQLPNGVLELMPGAGHAVWMDDPERAALTTRTFLEQGPRPSAK